MASGPASSARIIDSIPPDKRAPLFTRMSDESISAVRVLLTAGLMKPKLPEAVSSELIAAGYARQTTSGTIVLTDVGQVRAFMENGQ